MKHFLVWLALFPLALARRPVPAHAEFRVVGEVDYQGGNEQKTTVEWASVIIFRLGG